MKYIFSIVGYKLMINFDIIKLYDIMIYDIELLFYFIFYIKKIIIFLFKA
jgi:hypothetical protein